MSARSLPPVRRALVAAFVLATALVAGACTHKVDITAPGGGGGGGGGTPTVAALLTPPDVQAVFDNHCVFCHSGNSPSGGQNLGTAKYSYANLIDIPANDDSNFVRVLPRDPVNSYLLMKLRGDPRIHGSQMPLGDPPLDAATMSALTIWVASGAPAETVWASAVSTPAGGNLAIAYGDKR